MLTLKNIIAILMLTFCFSTTMSAQINVYTNNCNTLTTPQYDNGSTFNAGCYELPGSQGQVYQTSTQKEVVAEDHILLEGDVEFTASGSGQADLRIAPSPFDVVAYVPDLNSVPKLSKFELGIKPPENIITQVQNFLNSTGNDELNPFISDEIHIKAEFRNETTITIPHPIEPYEVTEETVKIRDGFFTKEVERDISGFDDLYNHPYLESGDSYWDPGGWYEGHPGGVKYQELGGGWTESFSEYPFRIRFAPPKIGTWECDITISVENGSQVFQAPTFTFEVVESTNKGYLKVDNSQRFFKRDGKSFMPLGLNYSWPGENVEGGYPLFTPGEDIMSSAQHYEVTPPIAVYEAYLRKMDTLADYGANYFRMIMCPWALDIEYEKLGDYSDRMHIAKEMDLILERAKANDMMIHWDLMIHYVFQDYPYDIDNWDWTQDKPDESDLYCYRSDLQLQLDDPIEFFTNPLSKKYYKERLRYIVARWGYSPNIAAFEHFSEIDQIGGSGDGDDEEAPYVENEHQLAIASWHQEMSDYLKDTLQVEQLISPSYTRAVDDAFSSTAADEGPDNLDYSFSLANLDIINYNGYDWGYKGSDNRKYPKNFEFFSSGSLYDVMNLGANNYTTGRGEYEKPVFYSEVGSGKIWECDAYNVEMKREIYQSMFSGLAGFLHWEIQRKDFYFDFRPLAAFFENVDLEGEEYHSGFTQLDNGEWKVKQNYIDDAISNDLDVDLTYLRSKDKNSAIGVITNRTYNYQTIGGCNSQNGDDPSYYYAATDDEQVKQGGVYLLVEDLGSRVKLRGMNAGAYDITYYKYNLENHIISTSSDIGPKVKLEFPQLNFNNWLVLFKAEKRNQKSNNSKNDQSLTIEEKRMTEISAKFSIFPNPTRESVSYKSTSELVKLELYDVRGKLIFIKENLSREGNIDVSKLIKGIYLVKASMRNGEIISTKLIIE